MTWEAGTFYIGPGEGNGYAMNFDHWPGLLYFLARPSASPGVKLKTEPFSITFDGAFLSGTATVGHYTYYTVVTN